MEKEKRKREGKYSFYLEGFCILKLEVFWDTSVNLSHFSLENFSWNTSKTCTGTKFYQFRTLKY